MGEPDRYFRCFNSTERKDKDGKRRGCGKNKVKYGEIGNAQDPFTECSTLCFMLLQRILRVRRVPLALAAQAGGGGRSAVLGDSAKRSLPPLEHVLVWRTPMRWRGLPGHVTVGLGQRHIRGQSGRRADARKVAGKSKSGAAAEYNQYAAGPEFTHQVLALFSMQRELERAD